MPNSKYIGQYKEYNHTYYLEHKDKYRYNPSRRKYFHEYYQKIRIAVLTHYGKGKMICTKCGFDDNRALSIDHINGKGKQDRGVSGRAFYVRLKTSGYPEGYQTLCMNCQFIKAKENGEVRQCQVI